MRKFLPQLCAVLIAVSAFILPWHSWRAGSPTFGISSALAQTNTFPSSGNVGVGTTSPMSVTNFTDITLNGGIGSGLYLQTTGTTMGLLYSTNNKLDLSAAQGQLIPLTFDVNNFEAMRITTSGYLGIGTASPTDILDVNGGLGFTTSTSVVPTNGMHLSAPNTLAFTTSGATAMTVTSTGGVGIGNTSPSYLLHVGSASASGIVLALQDSGQTCTFNPSFSTVFACSSDIRFKRDVRDSGSAMPWINDMHIRDYTLKATGNPRTGVVAQEVMLKHPEMVHEDPDGFYMVDSPNPWMLVKAIQEQQGQIKTLQGEVAALKAAGSQ